MSATMAYNGYTNTYPLAVSHLEPSDPKLQETLDFFPKHADMLISLHSHGIRNNKS